MSRADHFVAKKLDSVIVFHVMWMLPDIAKAHGSKHTSKCISRKIVSQNILSSPALAAEVSDTDDEVFVDDW